MDGDNGLFGGGVDGLEGLAVDAFNEFTVDEARVKSVRSKSYLIVGQMMTMRGGRRWSRLNSAATRMQWLVEGEIGYSQSSGLLVLPRLRCFKRFGKRHDGG